MMISYCILPAYRDDARKVAVKTKAGMTKIPGKACGGGYISASYKCGEHYTNGKLNEKGKAAAGKLSGKVRSLKGLPNRDQTKQLADKKLPKFRPQKKAEVLSKVDKAISLLKDLPKSEQFAVAQRNLAVMGKRASDADYAKLAHAVVTLQSAYRTNNYEKAAKAATMVRESVGLPPVTAKRPADLNRAPIQGKGKPLLFKSGGRVYSLDSVT